LYALGQLRRALASAAAQADPRVASRAAAKAARWESVLEGMASGSLTVGSRTPVAAAPAWVTLEVAHGGFATGGLLAECPLRPDELAVLGRLPGDVPGATDRERLNLWYLGDAGLARLGEALAGGRYRVELPEDAALLAVAWLLRNGGDAAVLDLVTQIRPFMSRLRFTPQFVDVPRPHGATVRLRSAGSVAEDLRAMTPRAQIAAMRDTARIWNPLFDRLVGLWCGTVEGELPHLSDGAVAGGWPCRRWPADWRERRNEWLADYRAAADEHGTADSTRAAKSNFTRLRAALQHCEADSRLLTARDVGWIRRALANTLTRHGDLASPARTALRARQTAVAERPAHAAIAQIVAGRLDEYPAGGGITSVDAVTGDIGDGDTACVQVPPHLRVKVARALEAPVDELVSRGIIGSGEVLAAVLPQLTSRILAAGISDPELAGLYEQAYEAFRKRRSLLLLNLEHQVQFDELPWIAAMAPYRATDRVVGAAARQTLDQVTLLAMAGFPHAIVPNKLVREMSTLAAQAGISVPLVEEVAADIFTGTFTDKWRQAAAVTSSVLAGTLYARYYDLPDAQGWAPRPTRLTIRRGKPAAGDFAEFCRTRSAEARAGAGSGGFVAANGAVLEQAQILTTHNLAALTGTLGLRDRVAAVAPDLADRAFTWAVRRQQQSADQRRSRLQAVKNAAYAWRQAIFFLSFCGDFEQAEILARLRHLVDASAGDFATRFGPAVDGLAQAVSGGRFDDYGRLLGAGGGRRFLGWSVGPHWTLGTPADS
jgi:hypothetical protein